MQANADTVSHFKQGWNVLEILLVWSPVHKNLSGSFNETYSGNCSLSASQTMDFKRSKGRVVWDSVVVIQSQAGCHFLLFFL